MTRTLRRFCVLLAVAALTSACSDKEEPGYTPPETAAQTHLMYMPWSGNLTSYFRTNIEDMARVVAEGIPADVRVLVYFMESPDEASLFELYRRGGRCERLTLRTYDPAPDFTAAEGIASVLGDVKREAPALRYSMSIGSHGMAWLPAVSSVPGRTAAPARREYWEHAAPNRPLTRWFGGTSPDHRTEIATLAEALARTGLHMEYILFDDCYMSSVEVAYELRGVTDYLIGSTSEIMAYGFPYASAGRHMLGEVDYEGICDAFHAFYSTYTYPYGTIGVTRCAGLEKLADIMRRINAAHAFDPGRLGDLQRLDALLRSGGLRAPPLLGRRRPARGVREANGCDRPLAPPYGGVLLDGQRRQSDPDLLGHHDLRSERRSRSGDRPAADRLVARHALKRRRPDTRRAALPDGKAARYRNMHARARYSYCPDLRRSTSSRVRKRHAPRLRFFFVKPA